MEKLKKFLLRLSPAERGRVEKIIIAIVGGRYEGLDIKKLKGHRDIFRVRLGDIRIIFVETLPERRILEISRRDDTTYKK